MLAGQMTIARASPDRWHTRFTATVQCIVEAAEWHPLAAPMSHLVKKIVRRPAARAIGKKSDEAKRKGEIRPLKGLQDLHPSARPQRRLSSAATALAKVASKEAWRGLDRAPLAHVRNELAEAGAGQTHVLGSFTRYSGTRITARRRRRMLAALNARIAYYRRCRPLLRHVTDDVLSAGLELFSTEDELAIWLCEPARALAGEIPIRAIHQAKGRARVVNMLCALAHGVLL